jgi:hypothetical protein
MMKKSLKIVLFTILCIIVFIISACGTNKNTEKTMLPQTKLLNNLKDSVFSDYMDSESNIGLSDISAVGVNKTEYEKIKYPVLSDSSFITIYNVADFGVLPENENNSTALNTFLEILKAVEGLKKVYFPEGTYKFNRTINISGIEDLYFCGNNTDFIFTSWCSAFSINDSENIHVNDINIDYNPSPTVSGVIKNCNIETKTIVISLYDEFDLTNSLYKSGTINYGSYIEFRYDEATQCYIPDENGNLKYNSTGDKIKSIISGSYNAAENELNLTFTDIKNAEAGTLVSIAFTMYEYAGILIKECENMFFESCNLYTTPGMAFICESVKNLYLNNTNIMLRAESKRLMTATADGLHCVDCYGDLVVTNSLYEYSHDDAINICSFYKEIGSNQAKTIVCAATSIATNYPIEKGDTIDIYDPSNFELKGTYTVTDVTNSMLTYTITVDKVITYSLTGCLVGNATRCPKLYINNNIFKNKRNRGILAQVRDSEISNNTFINIIHGSISIHSALDIFAEAIVPKNIVVKNNKFLGNNGGYGLSGDVSVFAYGNNGTVSGVISGIEIYNNFFYNGCQSGISLSGTSNSIIKDNLFFDICRKTSSDDYLTAIKLNTSNNLTVNNNCAIFSNKTEKFILMRKNNIESITETNNWIIDKE